MIGGGRCLVEKRKNRSMTPFEIDILLHYATCMCDHRLMCNPPPIWRETMSWFIAQGLLVESDSCDVAYIKTDRLVAYAEALQLVPLPVQKWVTPNA